MKKLNVLAGAPKGTNVKSIQGFYKNDTPGGVGLTYYVVDEEAAIAINVIFCLVELNYKTNPAETAKVCKRQLENKEAFIAKVGSEETANGFLLTSIWLLEKENLMPCDNYNGVVFVAF